MAAGLRARVRIPRRFQWRLPDTARQSFAPRSMSMRLRHDKGPFPPTLGGDCSFWAAPLHNMPCQQSGLQEEIGGGSDDRFGSKTEVSGLARHVRLVPTTDVLTLRDTC